MRQPISIKRGPSISFDKGNFECQKLVGIWIFSTTSIPWFLGLHFCTELMKFLLKNWSYLAEKVEGCHFENGCVRLGKLHFCKGNVIWV